MERNTNIMTTDKQIEEWAKIVERQEVEEKGVPTDEELLEDSDYPDFNDGSLIGTFTVDEPIPLAEMAKIGVLSGQHTYYVYVRAHERMKPHFHVYDKTGEHRKRDNPVGVHACVRIDRNTYFEHSAYTSKLDRRARQALDKFMREIRVKGKYSSNVGVSNYVHTIREWNDNNAEEGSKNWVDENREQPDYTTII